MVSVAEARNQLTAIIHQVEAGQPTTICRRGKPVAGFFSVGELERVLDAQSRGPGGWNRLLTIRRKLAEADAFADWSDKEIRQWRDGSPGRPVAIE